MTARDGQGELSVPGGAQDAYRRLSMRERAFGGAFDELLERRVVLEFRQAREEQGGVLSAGEASAVGVQGGEVRGEVPNVLRLEEPAK